VFEWLRDLKRKWRRSRGSRIFRQLCAERDPRERHRLVVELEERALPPDMLGWTRFYREVLRALAAQVRPAPACRGGSRGSGRVGGSFNWFFKEFAVTYPGMVPSSLQPRELAAFAGELARRAARDREF
jgi:hypothetical protein